MASQAMILSQATSFLSSVRMDVPTVDRLISRAEQHQNYQNQLSFGRQSLHTLSPQQSILSLPPTPSRVCAEIPPPFGLDLEVDLGTSTEANAQTFTPTTDKLDQPITYTDEPVSFLEFSEYVHKNLATHRLAFCAKSSHEGVSCTPFLRCSIIKFSAANAKNTDHANDSTSSAHGSFVDLAHKAFADDSSQSDDDEEDNGTSYRECFISPEGIGPNIGVAPYRFYATTAEYRIRHLDDPEMRLNSLHTSHKMLGMVTSIIPYVDERQQTDELNAQFRVRWPLLPRDISLSKIRRVKTIISMFSFLQGEIPYQVSDTCKTVAYVYFEKCVFQHIVNKANRRAIAGACLLLSFKFHELPTRGLVAALSRAFKVSEREILAREFIVFAYLGFSLRVDSTALA